MSDPATTTLKLEGRRVYLRPVRVSDVTGNYSRWMNDPEVVCHLESRFARHTPESLAGAVEQWSTDKNIIFLAIVLKADDRHIGNIKLGPIDPNHRLGDIGVVIGEKDCWGKGYATETVQLLTDHAFNELKLRKLTASCYEMNDGSARAFEKAGFVVEGVRRRQFRCEGRYVDSILLGKLNPAEPRNC